MKYFKFDKLVRDNIIDSMIANEQKPIGVKKLNTKQYINALAKKVNEESAELMEELADVLEVIDYLVKELDLSDVEIRELKKKKKSKNGDFSKRMYVDSVGVNEDNKWYQYYLDNPEKYPEVKLDSL